MVMGIDQARGHDATGAIYDIRSICNAKTLPDGCYLTILYMNIYSTQFPPLVIHRQNALGVFDHNIATHRNQSA